MNIKVNIFEGTYQNKSLTISNINPIILDLIRMDFVIDNMINSKKTPLNQRQTQHLSSAPKNIINLKEKKNDWQTTTSLNFGLRLIMFLRSG